MNRAILLSISLAIVMACVGCSPDNALDPSWQSTCHDLVKRTQFDNFTVQCPHREHRLELSRDSCGITVICRCASERKDGGQ